MYEEKYVALKRRLDLIRQIRDAPIVYACAVAEVIRRRALSQVCIVVIIRYANFSSIYSGFYVMDIVFG
jgi:hypothetical protein